MYTIASGCMGVELSLEDNLMLVHELGFGKTDLLMVSGWAHLGPEELLNNYSGVCGRVERALSRAQVSLGAVNVKYSVPLEATGEAAVQRQKEAGAVADFMEEFGVRRISIQPTLTPNQAILQMGYSRTIDEVMRLRAYYAERGKMLSLEPHIMSSFCKNRVLHQLRKEIPDFPLTFDPSHLLCEGEDMRTLLWLIPGATMVHLRDAAPGQLYVPYEQGRLDVQACVQALMQKGYDGPIAIEYICNSRPNAQTCENLLRFRQAIERALSKNCNEHFSGEME